MGYVYIYKIRSNNLKILTCRYMSVTVFYALDLGLALNLSVTQSYYLKNSLNSTITKVCSLVLNHLHLLTELISVEDLK